MPEDPRAAEIAAEGLPPRHVSWVVCCQSPGFFYGDRRVDVTPSWIDGRVAAFWAHKESKPGWIAPIQLNHTDTGERQGDFFYLTRAVVGKVKDEGLDWSDPRDTLLAALAWADPDAEAKIKAKILTHVSFGMAAAIQRPDTGEWLEGVPHEITKTGLPHLGEAAILGGALMPDKPEDMVDEAPEEEIEAMEDVAPPVDPMDKMMDMLERILKIVAPQPAAPAAEPAEMTTVEAQIVELSAMLAAEKEARAKAEKEAQRLTFAQAYPEGGSLTLTAEVLDYLFECSAQVAGFERIEAAYTAPKVEAPKPPPVSPAQPVWAKRVGSSHANPPVQQSDELTISAQAIDAEATKDGVKDAMLALQLHTQYRAKGYTITTEEV